MREVLFVSKPVVPPWNDGNKNLVRALAGSLSRYRPRVMVPLGEALPGVHSEPVYRSRGSHAPALAENARVMQWLCTGPSVPLWHFFFAPNPPTLLAGRAAATFRRVRTVHTVASAPSNLEERARFLFADRVVSLSKHTARRLASVGVSSRVIPPALEPFSVSEERRVAVRAKYALPDSYVLYAGDLEFGDGAATFVRAAAQAKEFSWVVASRPKTELAKSARQLFSAEATLFGARVTWLGEVSDMHAVLSGASMVVLVTDSLHGKVDWPLVLLEALLLGIPVCVAEQTAAAELVESGGASAVPASNPEAVVRALRSWNTRSKQEQLDCMESAKRWVLETCAPGRIAAAYEELYDEL